MGVAGLTSMRALLVLLVVPVLAGDARADPPAAELRASADRPAPAPAPDDDDDTFLHLDEHLRVTLDALGSKTGHFARLHQLGDRARVTLKSDWRQGDHESAWRAAIDGAYDLGVMQLVTSAGVEHVDTDLGRDTLTSASIGVRKTFRLSPTVTGWIGLTLGQRRWLGPPPIGEANATQLMLSAGLRY